MRHTLIKALVVLPGTVLVLVPTLILSFTGIGARTAAPTFTGLVCFWLGLLSAAAGFGLASWSVTLFWKRGQGTPAPWEPPRKLVVAGPYRHVRNPMITGVVLMLAAEALFFRSWGLAAWGAVFFLGNALYFLLVEEPGLEKRFGNDYRAYMANVPRWFPRRRAWQQRGLGTAFGRSHGGQGKKPDYSVHD
jgi:protein-S-isoprenylcysteine O-methyltransferase Ste14